MVKIVEVIEEVEAKVEKDLKLSVGGKIKGGDTFQSNQVILLSHFLCFKLFS